MQRVDAVTICRTFLCVYLLIVWQLTIILVVSNAHEMLTYSLTPLMLIIQQLRQCNHFFSGRFYKKIKIFGSVMLTIITLSSAFDGKI